MRTLLALAAVLALAACGGPTPYQPALPGYDEFGFREQRIEGNRYRVSFAGNSLTPRETVENYLLYRSAEVTLAQGADFFVVAERDTEPSTSYRGTGSGLGGFGGVGYGWGRRSSVFTGVGIDTADPVTRYRAYADIVIYGGRKPDNEPRAYDARQILESLKGVIRRPEAKS